MRKNLKHSFLRNSDDASLADGKNYAWAYTHNSDISILGTYFSEEELVNAGALFYTLCIFKRRAPPIAVQRFADESGEFYWKELESKLLN